MRTLSLLAFVAASRGLTILPLGDSITKGCGSDAGPSNNWTAVCGPDSGGYRAPLWASLTAAGFNVTFVGTQSSGPAWLPATGQHHEGHPGWRSESGGEEANWCTRIAILVPRPHSRPNPSNPPDVGGPEA